jgi:hypothetical protein
MKHLASTANPAGYFAKTLSMTAKERLKNLPKTALKIRHSLQWKAWATKGKGRQNYINIKWWNQIRTFT